MSQIYFSEDHEWVEVEGDTATVGITDYAQEQLGDVVFVETPEIGATLEQGDEAGVVESVKAASEVYSPVSGEVSAVNEELADNPGLVNDEPEDGAWFFKLTLADASELEALMDAAAYKAFCKEQG
ncbi:MAG: glycine cleavage system protein GcvH [Alphaproteobacteria bacterium]|nr:glycine cleavage system protein GcvH [Alphaproteobacteria bacterium]